MPSVNAITVQIAEDDSITRIGLKTALEAFSDIEVVAESSDGLAAILHALSYKPDVIVMDIGLPKMDGIKASKHIKEALPGVRIIMFTASDSNEHIFEALGAGADGYCLKSVEEDDLHSAILAVSKGVAWLDPGVADRVLRSGQTKSSNASHFTKAALIPVDKILDDKQMMVLQLLSKGAKLEDVAQQFDLTADSLALVVNATIALLSSSVLAHTNPSADVQEPTPAIIGERYLIEGVLGRGGMGIVYKGRHLLMDRHVAIKMLHPDVAEDEIEVKRFQSEAKSLSALSHPNLVAVFDYGITAKQQPYMVMDYHDGQGLDDILEQNGNIDLPLAVHIFTQVCDALTAVHEHNMIHRDVKPSNIVISEDGLVKLVDFGIAKSVDKKAMNLTMTGQLIGTPKYMSPEQCQSRALCSSSDIYSLGCVMYEVFTSMPPFDADTFYEMVRSHIDSTPLRFSQASPFLDVPGELEEIVFKALSKDPSQRQQSAAQLKSELLAVKLEKTAKFI